MCCECYMDDGTALVLLCVYVYACLCLPGLLKFSHYNILPLNTSAYGFETLISLQSKYSYQPHFTHEEFECKNLKF